MGFRGSEILATCRLIGPDGQTAGSPRGGTHAATANLSFGDTVP